MSSSGSSDPQQDFVSVPASFVITSRLYFGMRRQLVFEQCLEGVTPWRITGIITPNQPVLNRLADGDFALLSWEPVMIEEQIVLGGVGVSNVNKLA